MKETNISSFTFWHAHLTEILRNPKQVILCVEDKSENKSHLAKSQSKTWDGMRHSTPECISSQG